MFDQLSDRLQSTLSEVRSRGKLSEADVDRAMREIRLALLEADVNFKVVKSFTAELKERCLGAGVLDSLDPGQQVVKIVNEELAKLMGGAGREIVLAPSGTSVILMAGLQGSGKTTACAKLAKQLAKDGRTPALAACDTQRPAAIEQLVTVGGRAGVPVYEKGTDPDPVEIAEWALNRARAEDRDVLIVDTAGRLHVDEELMDELAAIKKRVKPHDVLLVLDAMTGQDAVNVATEFAERTDFDGIVLTKLDGDARGGAALSVKAVTGKPVMYASTGERIEELERFQPERMASRILGMGDVLSLIEKAEEVSDQQQAEELERKIRKQEFTLEDFLQQMRQLRRMGPLSNVLGMLPGMGGAMKQLKGANMDDRELDRLEAIILSMTPEERRRPEIIKGSRRKRIAQGSGSTVQSVNQLTKQFAQMQKLMKQLAEGKMPSPESIARSASRSGGPRFTR
ncbi:MAG TPA: signal recognition particle protein [Solirubrobacterales bacterium]|nr:signal recognition particle protein [Solirubrobacterales bacterium]